MYQIRKINYHTNRYEIIHKDIYDAGIAYELAHTYHAATMGLAEDEKLNEKHRGPFAIMITDVDGNSKWHECLNARCPTVGLLIN